MPIKFKINPVVAKAIRGSAAVGSYGVLCQLRARQASKQFVELVRSCSHSVPAPILPSGDGSEQINNKI